jgi:hypothetical protein
MTWVSLRVGGFMIPVYSFGLFKERGKNNESCTSRSMLFKTQNPVILFRIILKWIFSKEDGRIWTGFVWVSIETGGGLLLTR